MKLNTFTHYLEKIEKTTSRNKITEILADLINHSNLDEIDKVCYLSLGKLTPKYREIDFNLAEKMMLRIISQAFNRSEEEIKKKFQAAGDLGEVAESQSKMKKLGKRQNPSMTNIHQALKEVALESGEGSQERKIKKMAGLLQTIPPKSVRYLVRIPIGKLRLGFSQATLLDALSWSQKKDKSLRPKLQRSFSVSADIGKVAKAFRQGGIKALKKVRVQPGIPIIPALTEREKTMEKILERMKGGALVEPKYDGFRIQIHIGVHQPKEKQVQSNLLTTKTPRLVKIFSRSLEDITPMMPDISKAASKINVKSAILDGEAIGYNPKTDQLLTFQQTTQRKRKYDVKETARKIPLKAFIFDILYQDGHSLLQSPLAERRQHLVSVLPPSGRQKIIQSIKQNPVENSQQMHRLYKDYIGKGLEGIIIKQAKSPYHAGQRHFDWIKFKRATQGKLADSLDCLVMGYYFGRGKRNKFGIGAFLVGAYHPQKGRFYTIAKIGTGLTDDQWHKLYRQAQKYKTAIAPKDYQVPNQLSPNVWITPGLVVEVAADEITSSPLHSSGFALRFPRLTRFRSKSPTQISTVKEVKQLYSFQKILLP